MQNAPDSGLKSISEADRQIALRFAAARRFSGLTQKEMASHLDLSIFTVRNIEDGRTALRLWQVWKGCKAMNIHPNWVFGIGAEESGPNPFPDELKEKARGFIEGIIEGTGRALFSEAWPSIRSLLENPPQLPSQPATPSHVPGQTLSLEFPSPKRRVDNLSESANMEPVKTLKQLLVRLNKATEAKGMKTKLAAHLKAPLPCVSDWLSGKREPGGDTTIRMLHWVEQWERENLKK